MKRAVVTGAAGFAGSHLIKELVRQGYFVYGIVRPGSPHNERLRNMDAVRLVELDLPELKTLVQYIPAPCDTFFHLAWMGERDDFSVQYENVSSVLQAVEAAAKIGCRRFVCTGSQAEYGMRAEVTTEGMMPNPVNAYGAAKVAALYLSRRRAEQLGVDWVWGRIFSLYGPYEPHGRLLPDLMKALATKGIFRMTSAMQEWDYLYVEDAAKALVALMERGRPGEVYNVAHGDIRPLKSFAEYVRTTFFPSSTIEYAKDSRVVVALRPSVEKIIRDTGWCAKTPFAEGIKSSYCDVMKECNACG